MSVASINADEGKLLRRKEALVIAETTPEAQAMYALDGGRFVNCIEKSVLKPCDTKWVTCIDDVWVVKLQFGEICGIKQEERMDLVIVVDAKDGHIISRYPEAGYYTTPDYCVNSDDCLAAGEKCLNFVFEPLQSHAISSKACQCEANQCKPMERK